MNLATEIAKALGQHRDRLACACGPGMSGRMDCLRCCVWHAQRVVDAFGQEQGRWALERAELQEHLNDALAHQRELEHELVEERRNVKALREAADKGST